MKCPNCKDETLAMTEKKGVEIDYCPNCRGVWLDRGELDKIIERSNEYDEPRQDYVSTQQQVNPGYPDKKDSDYYNRHKKRKGFFGDFFDFD